MKQTNKPKNKNKKEEKKSNDKNIKNPEFSILESRFRVKESHDFCSILYTQTKKKKKKKERNM